MARVSVGGSAALAAPASARLRRVALVAAGVWIASLAAGWIADPRLGVFLAVFLVLAAASVRVNGIIGDEVARRKELHRDLAAARRIQQSMFPSAPPAVADVDFAMACRMCRDVGGDGVDVIAHDGRHLWLFVGDVSGKGIAAALVMSGLQATFRTLAAARATPVAIAEALDAQLLEQQSERYATGVILSLDTSDGRVEYVSAGHLPLVLRTTDGAATLEATGPPLGLMPDVRRASATAVLPSGGVLVLVTDGVTERVGPRGDFGIDGVVESSAMHQCSASELLNRILGDCQTHAKGIPPSDDLTVVVLRRTSQLPACA
jgi:sigma-B regulation protein RsbU (phosphoserine phosphatase)